MDSVDKAALKDAVRKTAKLRIEDVGGRKERAAETVQSCLNRGYSGLGSEEGLSYILRHAIKYYIESAHKKDVLSQEHSALMAILAVSERQNTPTYNIISDACRSVLSKATKEV